MKVIGWKAWYRQPGGSIKVYCSRFTAWADLPESGAQVFVIYFDENYAPDKPRRDFMYGQDCYYVDGDPTEQDSYKQINKPVLTVSVTHYGTELNDEEFEECHALARNEYRF